VGTLAGGQKSKASKILPGSGRKNVVVFNSYTLEVLIRQNQSTNHVLAVEIDFQGGRHCTV
jgi:hypothetical protein